MAEYRVWSLNRIESKCCDWTFYSSWNSLCCSDKLHFNSSLRPPCSPHHEGNMPAPFIVVTNWTKKCFLKTVLGKVFFGIMLQNWGAVFISAPRHRETPRVLTNTEAVVIICTIGHCRMSSLWKLYHLTCTITKAPTEFCKYHRNILYLIFHDFQLLQRSWEQNDNWSKPILSYTSECET